MHGDTDMGFRLSKLGRDERGATAVEYGLIISMIVLAMVGALGSVADTTIGMWNYISNEVVAASD
jgi:pilus assembly protein Flp/PilA